MIGLGLVLAGVFVDRWPDSPVPRAVARTTDRARDRRLGDFSCPVLLRLGDLSPSSGERWSLRRQLGSAWYHRRRVVIGTLMVSCLASLLDFPCSESLTPRREPLLTRLRNRDRAPVVRQPWPFNGIFWLTRLRLALIVERPLYHQRDRGRQRRLRSPSSCLRPASHQCRLHAGASARRPGDARARAARACAGPCWPAASFIPVDRRLQLRRSPGLEQIPYRGVQRLHRYPGGSTSHKN